MTLPNLNYTSDDLINGQINNFDLAVLQIIFDNLGIKVPVIHDKLLSIYPSITLDQIRNTIKRKISEYIEYKGSRKTGGYYFKITKK